MGERTWRERQTASNARRLLLLTVGLLGLIAFVAAAASSGDALVQLGAAGWVLGFLLD